MKNNWLQNLTCLIVALFASFFFYGEGKIIAYYLFGKTEGTGIGVCSIAAGIVIFLLLWRKMKKKMTLSKYYLCSILVSLVALILVVWFFAWIFSSIVVPQISYEKLSFYFNSTEGAVLSYTLFFVISILLAGMFGLFFLLLTRKKVRYLEYISREIKTMGQEGLENHLEVTGTDELSELSQSINEMAQALLQKERKERELITNISHDLRSPMTSILGYVDLIKQSGTSDPDKFNEYIQVVDRRLQSLNAMINELFELAKLSESEVKLNMQRQDVMLLLRQLAQENGWMLQNADLVFFSEIPQEPLWMDVDAEKIARAIQNLFENAGKYAVKHTEVRFTANVEDHQLTITLSNQFDREHTPNLSLLFDRFYKEDEARTNTNSSGLGLAIVKRIVQLHGGTVEVEMEREQILFQVLLPITM